MARQQAVVRLLPARTGPAANGPVMAEAALSYQNRHASKGNQEPGRPVMQDPVAR
jgi:hypothetical protein